MKREEMRVFHGLVNYGTQAGMFAKGLRDEGIEAISVVRADQSKRQIDFELPHGGSFWHKIRKHALNYIFLVKCFFYYNVFHFYYGHSLLPYNIDLYFYKVFRKTVIMEYLGHDVDFCLGMNGLDYRSRKCDRIKIIKKIKKQARLVHKQLVCAPYYYQFVDNSVILPLAIDVDVYEFTPLPESKRIKFVHCPTNREYKKSDYIETAIQKLREEGYDFEYKCVMNITHEELKNEYKSAHVVIDQLNIWYGTVSIEAMALGRPVVTGFSEWLSLYDLKHYSYIPIINANIFNIYDVLKNILDSKVDLEELGKKSRDFVEKNHDLRSLTKELVQIYENL